MPVDERLADLLLRREELKEQGQCVTPEELCRDCPELLDERRRHIQALQSLDPALAAACSPTGGDASADAPTVPGSQSSPPPALAVPGYEILGELGRGGMGVVYKARQISLDRLVALKVILAGAHAGTEQRQRFRGEAEAAARLQHPNIVQVYEIGEQDRCPYFSLEYVDGRDLHTMLFEGSPQPREVAALMEQVARAVSYAHQRSIVHRDLKPGNILLTPEGTPKITDFGLAKRLDKAPVIRTRAGVVLGTPSYMAPEQAAGKIKEIGPGTDIYSLGAILYELLTGAPPFEGPTAFDTVHLVLTAEPEPPSCRNPRVPRDLETICLKCLEKEPAKRYASARALADDLHRYQRGEPIQAVPVGRWKRLVKWARRRPAAAALVAVSILAALLLLGGAVAYEINLSRALTREKAARHEAVQRLVQLNVQTGMDLVDDGHVSEALPLLVEALRLSLSERNQSNTHPKPTGVLDERMQRIRLAMVLRSCPRLCRVWDVASGELVADAAFSPDGRRIVTASADGLARVWDVASGDPVGAPLRHQAWVYQASFSPDGSCVATASQDGSAMVWATAGKPITRHLYHRACVHHLAFSPNGRYLATCSDENSAVVWDIANGGKPITHVMPSNGNVLRVRFSPDGRHVLAASDSGIVQLWQPVHAFRMPTPTPSFIPPDPTPDNPFKVKSADGRLEVISEDGAALRVRDAKNGNAVGPVLRPGGSVIGALFDPAGSRLLVTTSNGEGKILEVATGSLLTTVGHASPIWCGAFSSDGTLVATGSADNTSRIWDAATGTPKTPLMKHYGSVCRVVFSPDRRYLLTLSDAGIARIWDAATGYRLSPPLDPEGWVKQVFAAPGDPAVWNLSLDERPIAELQVEAEWLSCSQIDQTVGLVPLSTRQVGDLEKQIVSQYPDLLTTAP